MRGRLRFLVTAVAGVAPALLLVSPAQAATQVALWHMESTGTMTDSSGNGNNGTTTAVTSVAGSPGNGYHFNGSTSRVDVPSSDSLNPGTGDITITVHVRFDKPPVGDYDVIRKGLSSTAGGEWKIEIFPPSGSATGPAFCLFKDSNKVTATLRGSANLADGRWHTITCAKTASQITLTVDGATKTKAARLGSISNTAPVTLGYKIGGGDWYLGDMDEVGITTSAASGGGGGDTTVPNVTKQTPVANATAVAVGSNVTATFSEPVTGVDAGTFTLVDDDTGVKVGAAVTQSGTTATQWILDPTNSLPRDHHFTATLTGGASAIRDLAGNPLATTSWRFLTGPAPQITTRVPAAGATGVSTGAKVSVTFNEPVQNVTTSTFLLEDASGAQVRATIAQNGSTNTWTLTPSGALIASKTYTATVVGGAGGVTDLAGNPLKATSTWRFST